MALTTEEKVKVIENHADVAAQDFREIMSLEMTNHASTILFGENSLTYSALPFGRKALVDIANAVNDNPGLYLDRFVQRYANDSEVTWATLITKIPDVVPAIYPEMAGLIRFDRPA